MIKAIDMLHVDKYINIFGMLHFFGCIGLFFSQVTSVGFIKECLDGRVKGSSQVSPLR